MKHVNVHGPQGCGKTRNAEKLRKKYGCHFVVDEGYVSPQAFFERAISGGHRTLYLTQTPMRDPDVTNIPFEEALR